MRRYPLIISLFLLITASVHGEIITVPFTGILTGFGSGAVYRGQTFTSLAAPSTANKLTVYVGPTADSGANFRVLLTEVDTTTSFHPTKVLFESKTLNIPVLPVRRNPDIFIVDLGSIRLEASREYAFILDHLVVANDADFVSMGTGTGPTYNGGFSFQFVNGPFLPTGTRQEHFALDSWFVDTSRDFAFTLNISPEPPPPPPRGTKAIPAINSLILLE